MLNFNLFLLDININKIIILRYIIYCLYRVWRFISIAIFKILSNIPILQAQVSMPVHKKKKN